MIHDRFRILYTRPTYIQKRFTRDFYYRRQSFCVYVYEKAQNFYRKINVSNVLGPFQSFMHKYPKIAAVSPATQIFSWSF